VSCYANEKAKDPYEKRKYISASQMRQTQRVDYNQVEIDLVNQKTPIDVSALNEFLPSVNSFQVDVSQIHGDSDVFSQLMKLILMLISSLFLQRQRKKMIFFRKPKACGRVIQRSMIP
jgi:hypothetical protein